MTGPNPSAASSPTANHAMMLANQADPAAAVPRDQEPQALDDAGQALAAVLAMAASPSQRLSAAKQRLNTALAPAQSGVNLKDVALALTTIAQRAHHDHTHATRQLPALHANLTQAIARSPTLANPITTSLTSLLPLPSSPSPSPLPTPCDQDLITQLDRLTTTRARIDSARVALADLRRWATLATTVLGDNADPSDAAQAFAAARDDLDRLANYLPESEHARRVGVLDGLRSQLWARLAPKLDAALTPPPAPPAAVPPTGTSTSTAAGAGATPSATAAAGDVAALYALAQRIGATDAFVEQYCHVRTSAILASAQSPPPSSSSGVSVLTVLAETIEHDLTTLPLLPSDRLPLSLSLLCHALSTLPLPDDPTSDPGVIARLARLYPADSKDFPAAILPLLKRIHALPTRSSRLALAAIDTLFDRIPLASTDAAHIDLVWRSQIMPSALAVASKVIAQHSQVCGGLRLGGADGLVATVRRAWAHMCTRIVRVLARVHELHVHAQQAAAAAKPGAGGAGGESLASALNSEAMARYVSGVNMAMAVQEKAHAVQVQLDTLGRGGAGQGVPGVVAEYLASKEPAAAVGEPLASAAGLVDLTQDVGKTALNFAFEYVLAPVTDTLVQGVLAPVLKRSPQTLGGGLPLRPSTPIARSSTPQQQQPGTPGTAPAPRATMVTTLPQFSRSPTPAATALGEYLLQLPHHLHGFAAAAAAGAAGVPGAHVFMFAEWPQTAVGKLLCSDPSDQVQGAGGSEGFDLLEAVVIGAQLAVVQVLASRLDSSVPAAPPRKTSDAAPPPAGGQHSTPSGSVAHSASTGRLASLVSSTLSGLPSSLSMRTGLADISSSSSSSSSGWAAPASATSPRLGRSATPTPAAAADPAAAASATALMPMDPGARDQLAQDLAYLGNVFTALDCAPRVEWAYVVGMVERGAPVGGWDASRVAGVLSEEVGKGKGKELGGKGKRVGRLAEMIGLGVGKAGKEEEEVTRWWGKVARVASGMFPPTGQQLQEGQ